MSFNVNFFFFLMLLVNKVRFTLRNDDIVIVGVEKSIHISNVFDFIICNGISRRQSIVGVGPYLELCV